MELNHYIAVYRPAIEKALKESIERINAPALPNLNSMLCYHMGWEGQGAGPDAQGKRIRPLLVLLCAQAAGGNWRDALPAAVSVELIHNFSLIHDDIQDRSELRRGRPTMWTLWGQAQAINTGDLMFTLAQQEMLRLGETLSAPVVLQSAQLLQKTCIELTEGQFLDIENESRRSLSLEDYWHMVGGKTAALLSCCCQLGAISAGASEERQHSFARFGYTLGLAFQVWDDWLGVWGNSAVTGKSTESDLVSGKKTLPVVYAMRQEGEFSRRWLNGDITVADVPVLAECLVKEGAQRFTESEANRLTGEALKALDEACVDGDTKRALISMAGMLLQRKN